MLSAEQLEKAYTLISTSKGKSLPFRERGISINRRLIETALTILANAPNRTLPQNARNAAWVETPDGMDKRIKRCLGSNVRTANIVSDILSEAGIVKIIEVTNEDTKRVVKGTHLLDESYWGNDEVSGKRQQIRKTATVEKLANDTIVESDITKGMFGRKEYLDDEIVQGFILWLTKMLDEPGSFTREYYLAKAKRVWYCTNLFDAYEKYWWPFRSFCPQTGRTVTWESFNDSFAYLTDTAQVLRNAVEQEDKEATLQASLAVLRWGGVLMRNDKKLFDMNDTLCMYYKMAMRKLHVLSAKLGDNYPIIMNSGFTKIYSLLIDDFIIYDGRVGAALGLLSRKYTEERSCKSIPDSIRFSYGAGRREEQTGISENRRNPSTAEFRLPSFTNHPQRQTDDNVKANWLLGELAKKNSSFADLPAVGCLNYRVTAIQAALFMIGYDVRTSNSYGKAEYRIRMESGRHGTRTSSDRRR